MMPFSGPASLPALWSPAMPRWHPDAPAIAQESLAWLRSFDLEVSPGQWAEIEAERAGYWFCLFAPGAVSRDRVRLGADYFTSFFPYDDMFLGRFAAGTEAEAISWAGRWCRLLDDPRLALGCDHPVTPGMTAFARRLHEACTPTQYRRFAEAMKAYMTAVAWEVAGRDEATRSRLNDAVACRIYASGVLPTIAMLHATHDLHISDTEFDQPAVRAFTEATAFLIAIHNDVFSYPKEKTDNAGEVNLLATLVAGQGCTLIEGVARLIELNNQVTARAIEMRACLAPMASPDLLRYLNAALEMAAGDIEFEQDCVRYHRGASQFPLPPITVTHQRPPDTPPGPPDIPTIACWWDDFTTAPPSRDMGPGPVTGLS